MKLLMSVLDSHTASRVSDALAERRYGVTRVNTVGGFLRSGNLTLLVGVDDFQVKDAIRVMREAYALHAPPGDDSRSGPVFVLGVEHFDRY